jgi:prepilin-type N-terminal cleavage/methylation domain-containing protein
MSAERENMKEYQLSKQGRPLGYRPRASGYPQRTTDHATRNTHQPPFRTPHSAFRTGFTLIELLVVISIIALLAAMIFPITGVVNKQKLRARARTELNALVACIDRYHAKLGHYPPDNPGKPALNQLYYELTGTTNSGKGTTFGTLDHNAALTPTEITGFFGLGVSGFVNSTKLGNDESAPAQHFLGDLRAGQVADVTYSGFSSGPDQVKMLICTVPGSDPNPSPLLDVNRGNQPVTVTGSPWRYNSSNPTNNPSSYDLWVDIVISGKTNRICNWSTQPILNP